MARTPFLPAWLARLAPAGSRMAPAVKSLRSFTRSKLADRFACAWPARLFPKAKSKVNRRDRLYTQRRTFWCFLWQCLTPNTSCRQVVRQVQALGKLFGGPQVSQEDGAYCRARLRLPAHLLSKALASGAIVSMLSGNLLISEWCLLHPMLAPFKVGDIALGDRGVGNYVVVGLLRAIQVDFIGRSARQVDGRRRRQHLGRNDWLVQWRRSPNPSAILSAEPWDQLPKELTVRLVRGSLWQPGFRVRQVTLLDPKLYPAEQILRASARRWRLERCWDDLKTTLGMERLRCQSAAMVQKEVYLYLIAHHLIRRLMAQAAYAHPGSLEGMRFKGTLAALRQFSQARCQARRQRKGGELWDERWPTLAADL